MTHVHLDDSPPCGVPGRCPMTARVATEMVMARGLLLIVGVGQCMVGYYLAYLVHQDRFGYVWPVAFGAAGVACLMLVAFRLRHRAMCIIAAVLSVTTWLARCIGIVLVQRNGAVVGDRAKLGGVVYLLGGVLVAYAFYGITWLVGIRATDAEVRKRQGR